MNDLSQLVNTYKPNDEVASSLKDVHFVAIVGPSSIGKNAVCHEVVKQDSTYEKIVSHVTREPLSFEVSGKDYYFEEPSTEFFTRFEERLKNGELVQVAIHPKTGHYYYSTTRNYNHGGKSMMDILPMAVEAMRQVPFGKMSEIMIVADFEDWREWFETKATEWDGELRAKRIEEAISNLQWGLNQESIAWVINKKDQLKHTAEKVIEIVNGQTPNYKHEKELAQKLIEHLENHS